MRRFYPDVDEHVLGCATRGPAVIRRVAALAPDIAGLRERVAHLADRDPPAATTLICGDLNVLPGRDVLALLRGHGYADAGAAAAQPTCNPNGRAECIDFIVQSEASRSSPLPLPALADDTPMPSASEPSDHLPIGADLSLVS